jgi:hypothetical protein
VSRPAVAFVVQRYGADVAGGSEALARALAERIRGADHGARALEALRPVLEPSR